MTSISNFIYPVVIIVVRTSKGWDCSIAATEVRFQDIGNLVPIMTSDNHSRVGLVRRDALEPQLVLVEEVHTGVGWRASLRLVGF